MMARGTRASSPGRFRVTRLFATAATVLTLAVPALAANRDLERLQQQIATLESQVADLKRGSDDTLKELKRLNEALADENASLKKALQDQRVQQESFQASLKEVMDRLGTFGERLQTSSQPPSSSAPSQVPSPTSSTVAPRELYSQAYADYARGNYDLAIQGFQEYLRQYPNTDFSDNAEYWIGECLFGKGRYADALDAWKKLFTDFPTSEKTPDAHFKRGVALERLGRRSQALLEYRFVVDRYPNSEAGRRARDKLNPQ